MSQSLWQDISIATANTCFGRAVQTPNSLCPLSKVDVLLLQELYSFNRAILKKQLLKIGFRIVCAAPEFGLVIALRIKSPLRYVPRSAQKHRLAKLGWLERIVIQRATRDPYADDYHVFLERGLLSAALQTPDGRRLTIATTHPTTPLATQYRARYRQIVTLQSLLEQHYLKSPLILGGDMNHYPKPKKVDRTLHETLQLRPIDIGNEPTWRAQGSKQERLLSLVAFISRRPLNDYDGQHDIILYREKYFTSINTDVRDIDSDHRAVIATFRFS